MTTLLNEKATEKIYRAIMSIVSDQGFNFNEDLSESEKSYQNKDFTLKWVSSERSDSDSNRQNIRVLSEFLVTFYYVAQAQTFETYLDMMNDADNLLHALERFAPEGEYSNVPTALGKTEKVSSIETDTVNIGSDVMLKMSFTLLMKYKIPNPN